MANFMGPMAPPQAAPQTPPQLDIRTNPGQRAQFKEFMQGMNRPVMPPTTAPIAPMLPAPTPMDQIDIFAPAPMADGGVVGGLQDLGKISGQMVEDLNTVLYGGGQGGDFGGGMSSGSGFGGGNMPPPLPFIPERQPVMNQGPLISGNAFQPLFGFPLARPIGSGSMDPFSPMNDSRSLPLEDRMQGATPEDAYAQAQAVARRQPPMQGGLGAVLFEDGGPVRMRRGGSTFRTGSDGRTVISSDNIVRDDGMTDRERAAFSGIPSGVSGDDPYDEFSGGSDDNVFTGGIGTGDTGSVSLTVNQPSDSPTYFAAASGPDDVIQQQRAATDMDNLIARNQQTQQEAQNLLASMSDIDESAGDFASVSPVAAAFTPAVDPQRDLLFGEPIPNFGTSTDPIDDFDMLTLGVTPYSAAAQQDALSDFLDRNPQPEPRDDARPDMVMRQNPVAFDPMTAPYMGMGADDFDFGPALPRDADIINNLLNRRVNYTTRGGNVIDRTVQDDLIARGKPSDLPGFVGGIVDALSSNRAGKYLDQIAGGAPGVIDAKTGQLVGYVGDGFIKGTQVFSGRPGYNPFTGDAQNVKFDPSTNSYIVTPALPGSNSDERAPRALPQQVAPPVTDSTPADPPVVVEPVAPSPRPDPMNVVVPSTRVADPLGLTPPAFAPVQSVGLPQSFLDLLASFNRPAPVAMQEGGAVLDQAAGNFLEALKVA